jgi:hypothetical protein
VGEIIDAAIKVVSSNARVLFTIAAMIFAPLGILQLLAYTAFGAGDIASLLDSLAVEDSTLTDEQFDLFLDSAVQLLILVLVLAVLAGVGTVLAQGATVKAVADVYQGSVPEWQQSIRFGFRRFFAILGAVLMVFIGSTFGLIFCLVPGVWLYISWSVTVPALVVEHLRAFEAIQRSYRLVRRRFWPVLGVVVLSVLLYGTISYLFSLAGSLFTFLGDGTSVGIPVAASVISSTLSSIVVQPFIAAVLIVLYFDLRVRAEGYDLRLMATELGDGTPPPPPTSSPDDPFGLGSPGP